MKTILASVTFLLLLSPRLQAQNDVVEFYEDDPTACCFLFGVSNEHDPKSPIGRIRLSVITPGVTIRPGNDNPWPISVEEDTMLLYGEEGYELEVDDVLEGFSVCFDRSLSSDPRFRVVWRTEYRDEVLSKDTVEFECEAIQNPCDSVSIIAVTQPQQPVGSCCYEFVLHNVNPSFTFLDGLELELVDSGARLVGTPSGPWQITAQSERSVTFRMRMDSLGPGESLGGFRVCIERSGSGPGPVSFVWRTLIRDLLVCEGLVTAYCTPSERPQCDSLLLSRNDDCSYDFGFRNGHTPASVVNGFRMRVLTPGARLDSARPPGGWEIVDRTALGVTFGSDVPAGVAPGDSLRGFALRFIPPANGSFSVTWCTLRNDTVICCDTIVLQCDPPPPVFCDSLLVERQGSSCTYELGFVNTHSPQSPINDFHIRLETQSASVLDAVAPAPWFLALNDGRNLVFRDTLGVVPPNGQQQGFFVTFSPAAEGDPIVFEWCTSLDTTIHCCAVASVECEVQEERCDSLYAIPSQDYCSYAFGFANLHVPISGVDGFSIRLTSSQTTLLDAEPTAGWLVEERDHREVIFRKIGAPLPNGTTAEDFILHLLPSASDRRIPLTMCTLLGDSVLCCDTLTVFCEFQIVRCDTVDVLTNAERPCCFEFELRNAHLPLSAVDGFRVEILTPDVIFYPTTVDDPDGWLHTSTRTRINWQSRSSALQPGNTLGGFTVCYDNDATGNADFRIAWQSLDGGDVLCEDTLTIKCDRTLDVRLLPGDIPPRFMLHQNYPNPFNPVTTIVFDVPQPADVTLSLYDSQGRLVMDLGSRYYHAGSYRITLDASYLPSGAYFYQLRSAQYSRTRSLLLLR